MTPADLFITIIYQPFFNILILFYWMLGYVTNGQPDMGIAVILLTIVVRLLLLPLSLAGDKSEPERRAIAEKVKEIERVFSQDPARLRAEKKKYLRGSRKVLIAEIVNLFVQVGITLMLWKIFGSGLAGEDLHLIYSWMPDVETPFNLKFLGIYDLTQSSLGLNIVQTFLIFVVETLSVFTSPYPVSRSEVVRLQLVLPLVSFIIFAFLPAGKKLFVITSLLFSVVLLLIRAIMHKYQEYVADHASSELETEKPAEEKLVVEVK